MANISFSFFSLILSLFSIVAVAQWPVQRSHYSHGRAYVESECQRTLYPKLCVSCLSGFVSSTSQSPQELAQAALKVSIVRARYASTYMSKISKGLKQTKSEDYQAVQDCINQINDGVSQLSSAIKELQRLSLDGENAFIWHQSNVETWMSTMETNAFTCMEGISGYRLDGRVRRTIQAKVLNVAQATSNALALFDHFAAIQRASFTKNKP